LRERWQLAAYQQLSPGWQQQLAFTLTVTTSYDGAAALLRQLGHQAEDPTLHTLAQTLGARAEAQTQERMKRPVQEQTPQGAAGEVGVLMLAGWRVRQRGPGWGKKKTLQPRVEWHELKTGVFYMQEQAVPKNGRGLLSDKGGSVGKASRGNWGNGSIKRPANTAWAAPGRNWWSAMARRGSGRWRKTAGPARWRCWIFITPASRCGIWGRP
jgi:hypothetical protein